MDKCNCDKCGQFIHDGLLPIHDYFGVTSWFCVNCSPIGIEEYDKLMERIPNYFKEQVSKESIQEFRKIISTNIIKCENDLK